MSNIFRNYKIKKMSKLVNELKQEHQEITAILRELQK